MTDICNPCKPAVKLHLRLEWVTEFVQLKELNTWEGVVHPNGGRISHLCFSVGMQTSKGGKAGYTTRLIGVGSTETPTGEQKYVCKGKNILANIGNV